MAFKSIYLYFCIYYFCVIQINKGVKLQCDQKCNSVKNKQKWILNKGQISMNTLGKHFN